MQPADTEGARREGAPAAESPASKLDEGDAGGGPRTSTRFRLAQLAAETALKTKGVAGLLATRSVNVTAERGEIVKGVVVAAQSDGRYAVTIHVAARLVPLQELGDQIRSRLARSGGRQGVADDLGRVDVVIEDVLEVGVQMPSDPEGTER